MLIFAGEASAQLEGRLYLDKTTYIAGEPIYLNFELVNKGSEAVQFWSGDSYSFCGGYRIDVATVPPVADRCSSGAGGSCVLGKRLLEAGEARDDKVLLNYDHDLSKPGLYNIHAARFLRYGPVTESFPEPATQSQFKVQAKFQVQVLDIGHETRLVPMFQPFVADLHSNDEQRQREAARAIGSLAPSFLENTLFAMLDTPAMRPFAILGLWHLNTVRSRDELAKTVEHPPRQPYSYQSIEALRYLSQMGDKKYWPLLLDEAKKKEPDQAQEYVIAAARLGGEDAMPFLISLLGTSDPFSRENAIEALPETDSRDAVPLLIQELLDGDTNLARIASSGLVRLTHRSPVQHERLWNESPRGEYLQWQQWWATHWANTPIFPPTNCGAVKPFH